MRNLTLVTLVLGSLTLLPACGGDDGGTGSDNTGGGAADAVDSGSAGATDAGQTDAGAVDTGPTAKDVSSSVACHPVNNTGCPAGQHCIWQGNSITCVDDGEHAAGEDCSDGKGCKIGVCVGVQGSSKSVCSPHCLADLQCASGQCNALTDSKGKVCDMGVTVAQCDPLKQACSGAGEACYAGGNGFVCMAGGSVEAGQACPEDNSCKPGLACVGKSGASAGVCRKICSVNGGSPSCDDITTKCSPLLGSPSAGYCGG